MTDASPGFAMSAILKLLLSSFSPSQWKECASMNACGVARRRPVHAFNKALDRSGELILSLWRRVGNGGEKWMPEYIPKPNWLILKNSWCDAGRSWIGEVSWKLPLSVGREGARGSAGGVSTRGRRPALCLVAAVSACARVVSGR